MNIRDLQYLVAVAELQHYGRAAERCFVSQPTLSTQLKKLENELGVQLFERSNKHVMTTRVGEKVIEQAKQVLDQVQSMHQIAKNSQDPLAGDFRLGVIPTLAPYILPHMLCCVRRELPSLHLHLFEDKTEALLEELREGKLDAVLLALPIAENGLESMHLFNEPLLAALPTTHLLGQAASIRLNQLNSEALLLLEKGHCLRDQVLDFCQTAGMRESSGFQATNLETLREMVAVNSGVTLLPALSKFSVQQHPSVTLKPFDEPSPFRQVGMLWRSAGVRELCCKKLGEVIQQEIKHKCDFS